MPRESPMDLAAELESLLPTDSKSMQHLALLQRSLRSQEESEGSAYTKSRATALRDLALRMKSLVQLARKDDYSYADRAHALSTISDSYLKLAHAFKTDPQMWSLAQSELVPAVTSISVEENVDSALSILETHLNTYLKSLDFWLEK